MTSRQPSLTDDALHGRRRYHSESEQTSIDHRHQELMIKARQKCWRSAENCLAVISDTTPVNTPAPLFSFLSRPIFECESLKVEQTVKAASTAAAATTATTSTSAAVKHLDAAAGDDVITAKDKCCDAGDGGMLRGALVVTTIAAQTVNTLDTADHGDDDVSEAGCGGIGSSEARQTERPTDEQQADSAAVQVADYPSLQQGALDQSPAETEDEQSRDQFNDVSSSQPTVPTCSPPCSTDSIARLVQATPAEDAVDGNDDDRASQPLPGASAAATAVMQDDTTAPSDSLLQPAPSDDNAAAAAGAGTDAVAAAGRADGGDADNESAAAATGVGGAEVRIEAAVDGAAAVAGGALINNDVDDAYYDGVEINLSAAAAVTAEQLQLLRAVSLRDLPPGTSLQDALGIHVRP